MILRTLLWLAASLVLAAQTPGDLVVKDVRFASGEKLPELRLHYATLGTLRRDAAGRAANAVLILHGTGGSHAQFLRPEFQGELFGPGQPLDASRYFLIIPDNLGHGRSSKPSDGLRTAFPKYTYDDMVALQKRLLDHLGVDHLRLVMGTSMGGMHTWMWATQWPDFMDAALPLACLPVEIAGRNRFTRRMILDSIRLDPAWKNGDYTVQPFGLRSALYTLMMMGSSPLTLQTQAPTLEQADRLFDQQVESRLKGLDANDLLYQVDSIRTYNPAPHLARIRCPLVAVNSADDAVNPPELGILEREIRRVPKGQAVLLPITPETRGHGTHTLARLWKEHLAGLLKASEGR